MKEFISVDTVLNEIRLHSSHPQNRNSVFILVEGESDIRLFRKFFNRDCCKVISIPGGNTKLEEGIEKISNELDRIFGIRDADFMHLESKSSRFENLFLTDTHDLETMTIKSDIAFASVKNEFYNNGHTLNDLRIMLFEAVSFLGYFRWYNDKNNLEFNFKEIGIGSLIDVNRFEIVELDCIDYIIKRSPNCKIQDRLIIQKEIKELKSSEHDLFQVCCGHDVATAMVIFFNNQKAAQRHIDKDRIQSSFRIAYNIEEFKNSNLYNDIQKWASANNYNLFLN